MLALRGCQIDVIKILYGYENINPNTYVWPLPTICDV